MKTNTPLTDELERRQCDGSGTIDYAYLRNQAMNHARRMESGRAELLGALEVARSTIRRLEVKHGTFSSVQGTIDVIDAALAKTKG